MAKNCQLQKTVTNSIKFSCENKKIFTQSWRKILKICTQSLRKIFAKSTQSRKFLKYRGNFIVDGVRALLLCFPIMYWYDAFSLCL